MECLEYSNCLSLHGFLLLLLLLLLLLKNQEVVSFG